MDKKCHSDNRKSITNHRILIVNANSLLKISLKSRQKRISPDNTLTILGKNLYFGEYRHGSLKPGRRSLFDTDTKLYRTTKWFPITPQGKSLVLSGTAHNRSNWQFRRADQTVIIDVCPPLRHKVLSDVSHDKTLSKVEIPPDAEYARVYFADLEDPSASSLDKRLQIEYGNVPTHYEPYTSREFKLPRLKLSQSLEYENGEWYIRKRHKRKRINLPPLDLKVGDTLLVDSELLNMELSWDADTKDKLTTGIYGVRWNTKEPNPVCERIGDAKGLHFNYFVDDIPATPYQNDFDRIYPWSDIKICAVTIQEDGTRKVVYENEEGFCRDGSLGNIMVEIPKFYCKREIKNDYEHLWISGTPHEDFQIDPSFQTAHGTIDHVYIGAYLSTLEKDQLFSHSNSFPLIKKSLSQLQSYIENSREFKECDLLAILTIQKLYLVETAVLDSQSLFTGNVFLPYLLKNKATSYYALRSEKATNRIYVKITGMTKRFRVGDAVSILDSWDDFENEPNSYQREITEINNINKDTFEIVFTGDPVDIVEGVIGITCIPCKNGETDAVISPTGRIKGKSGHTSFKYRGIENLWGNVFILLDQVNVKNSQLTIHYPTGDTVPISYPLPVQKVQLSPKVFGDPDNMFVKKMGYDEDHPLIMLPFEIGNGATNHSYYCDAWYNLANEDVTYVITYGGAWDNKSYAGIFNFRATFTKDEAIPFNGSRIILR